MFFIFSKVLSFLLSPVFWAVILVGGSFLFKAKKIKRNLMISGVAVLIFFSNSFIADEFVRLWEVPVKYDKEIKNKKYEAGIVLGGGMITKDAESGRITFRNNVDRILQAIDLYDKGIIANIVISSGSGSLIYRNIIESVLLKDYLVNSLNIPDSVILIDSTSDNTYQNAVNTSGILNKKFKNGKYLLITSSLHMRRALACFQKQNLEVEPFPTGKLTGKRQWNFWHLAIPDVNALQRWQFLIHEVAGFIIYFLIGYI